MGIQQSKKRCLILGSNGYIGVPLYERLTDKGYNILGIDNESRERNVLSVGGNSLTYNRKKHNFILDISTEYKKLKEIIQAFQPDVVINLAQQPSAPFSMKGQENSVETQRNNIMGNLNVLWAVKEVDPNIHIIQLGTAGEYPDWLYTDVEVPEGSRINVRYKDKDWEIPTPRYAGSWYHFSKLHSSYNADYACRIWKLRVTDVNQGIVYGFIDGTRLDYDEYFGTVVNRFVTQAVAEIPLTIYGKGNQMRSFINLKNSIGAIELMIDHPAKKGEYRIIHQLTETYTVNDIAKLVKKNIDCEFEYLENPRAEMATSRFKFEAKKLKTLGLEIISLKDELPNIIKTIKENKDKINKDVIKPKTTWK